MAIIDFDYTGPVERAARGWQEQEDLKARELRQRDFAKQDAERPLSDYEKFVGEVLSGRMSPKDAAIMAQLEEQNRRNNSFKPPPQQPAENASALWSQGGLSAGPMNQGEQQTYEAARGGWAPPQGGLSAPMQRPTPAAPPPRQNPVPTNARELDTAFRVAPMLQKDNRQDDINELRWRIALLNSQTSNNNNQRTNDTRVNTANARTEMEALKLQEKKRQHDETLQYKYAALQTVREKFQAWSAKGAEANDLKLFRIYAHELDQAFDHKAALLNSISDDPNALKNADIRIQQIADKLQQHEANMERKYFGSSSQPPTAPQTGGGQSGFTRESSSQPSGAQPPQGAAPPMNTGADVVEPPSPNLPADRFAKPGDKITNKNNKKPNAALDKLRKLEGKK
jgi:hypothetical protein